MKRVMFVDDDTNILAGLKRSMRVMRHEWDMEFIEDPQVALEAFGRKPFDIVVSDMKMPRMDGADLLAEIRRLGPESIRIVLSGHSDSALIMKSVGQTHQYLAKPCEPDVLKRTIERAYALSKLVGSDTLRHLVSGLGELPSLPSAYQEIVTRLQDPDVSIAEIAGIVGQDVGMTTKTLQLVNSSFFGIANPLVSIEQAVTFLGLDTIGTLVLVHGVFSQYQELDTRGFDIEALWRSSARCATIARIVAQKEEITPKAPEEAFLAGMLHDVGKLVLASEKPEEYGEVLQRVGGQDACASEVEIEILGATHADVGAYLVGLWGLPDTIVEAVAYHEMPSRCHGSEFGVFGAVHVASQLAINPAATDQTDPSLHVDLDYLEKAGVADRWSDWQTACQESSVDGQRVA